MLTYINKVYTQLKQLYNIKTHIDKIYNIFDNTNNDDTDTNFDYEINKVFESLKQIIFDCGSLYIKFFQWYISNLKTYIINNNSQRSKNMKKFIDYFEDIFEQCPYHSLNHTKKIFKESMYGILLEEYIDISTLKLIASGSIGQVYYGKRKKDNIEVAVKVKHPNIESDLENQYELIKLFKFIQSISFFRKKYNLLFNIDDFLEDINLQCDFNNEANNTTIFINNFKESSKYIVFPEVLYQSKDLLITEYIEGNDVNSLSEMQKYHTSLNFICFFKQMLFVDNFIHGDLHSKNWKIRYNKKTNNTQIIVYDCGICFKNIYKDLSIKFWLALLNYDVEQIIIILKKFIKNGNELINEKFDNDVKIIFKDIIKHSLGTSTIMKGILNLFKINNLIVHKFLLNFTILICVIEEYMKSSNLINKNININISMFDIINDCQLDIIAFCDVKQCYPQVKTIFEIHMKDNYKKYNYNIINNQIENNVVKSKKLFSSISLSGLTFKPPE